MSVTESSLVRPAAEPTLAERYRRDGVVRIERAFDEREMGLIEQAVDWRLANSHAKRHVPYPGQDFVFFHQLGNSHRDAPFEAVLRDTRVADHAAALFGSGPVWYVGEQIFFKEGEHARRTPWHQDASYLPFGGEKIAQIWIPLHDVPREASLEVIPGSHRGPTYDGMPYDLDDDTKPIYQHPDFPRLPDIEARRGDYPITAYAMRRGDALIFHTGTLHGGGGTSPSLRRRRSLTLRFFGDDARRVFLPELPRSEDDPARTEERLAEVEVERFRLVAVGDPLHRAPNTRQVRPWSP